MKTPLIIVLASVYGGLSQPLPGWTGPDLNPLMPLGGVPLAANVTLVNVLRATLATGTFNSDPMIDFHDNQLMVSWPMSNGRNGSIGTSILYSQSMDGVNWTATDGSNVLFPALGLFNMSEQLLAAPSLRSMVVRTLLRPSFPSTCTQTRSLETSCCAVCILELGTLDPCFGYPHYHLKDMTTFLSSWVL
jgi:hypothetical protein